MSEREDFAAFVAAHQATLRRTAFLVCGDWDLASDHVQEGLIRLYRHWRRLERAEAALSYARKAVVSAAIDAGRRRSSTELVTDRHDEGAQHDDPTGAWDERRRVLAALATLPPRQRACVVLRYYEDLPVAEVAAVLGIADGTVKSQTAKGLASLGAALDVRGATHARHP